VKPHHAFSLPFDFAPVPRPIDLLLVVLHRTCCRSSIFTNSLKNSQRRLIPSLTEVLSFMAFPNFSFYKFYLILVFISVLNSDFT